MRPIFLALILVPALAWVFPSSLFCQEQETHPVKWMTVEEALAANRKEPRKIFIDVYTQWCGPCRLLSKNTFADDEVSAYLNAHFYCVKFDAESADTVAFGDQVFTNPGYQPGAPGRNAVHQFTQFLGVNAYPTMVLLDEQERLLMPVVGYKTPPELELFLKLVAENHYRGITTREQWDSWQAAFVPAWR